jgi:hypothetical protein
MIGFDSSLKRIVCFLLYVNLCFASSHETNSHSLWLKPVLDVNANAEPTLFVASCVPRGGAFLPAGWNPFGYKITPLGEQFLSFDGSLDSDVGRFLASLKTRKTAATLKSQWIEIVKVSKTGQTMRIYRMLQDLLNFCVAAGFIN